MADEKINLGDIIIEKDLVNMHIDSKDREDALRQLANVLYKKSYVKESFIQAVVDREKTFYTGLTFPDMGMALPHTDSVHVNQQAIAIGILDHPVEFIHMGTEDEIVHAEIMFMMAIQKPDQQVNFLSKMMEIFSTEGRLKSIKNAKDENEVAELFKGYLLN